MADHRQTFETIWQDLPVVEDVWGRRERVAVRYRWSCACGLGFSSTNKLDVCRAQAVHRVVAGLSEA